jgi:RecB family endonuclease NucS
VIAQCTVDYLGRLTAHLPSARRLLLIKADGSVSVHADDRAYKPLNWMSPPCWLTDDDSGVWVVENKAGEKLRITIEEIEHDSSHELGVDPGLVKDGVEAHLQELLAGLVLHHPDRGVAVDGLGQPARRAHPVQRFVGTVIGVHTHRAVGFDE